MITMFRDNFFFKLNDDRLYKIVDTKIKSIKFVYFVSTYTVSYKDMNICFIAYNMTITQNPFMQYNAQLYGKKHVMNKIN